MDLEYNTGRPDLVLPEHGRNVKKMINFALTVEDKEERNKVVNAIIKIMGQLNPQLRDVEDYNHKLWDHLFILSDFKLDVDSPYPIPTKETFDTKPEQVPYPSGKIRYGHYGKTIQNMIESIPSIEKEEDKKAAINATANLMKRFYLTWNRDSVEDETIVKQLNELAKDKFTVKLEDIELKEHKDVQLRSSKERP
ncbi:MAG: DUF4290 domain-containing protein, partial [Flavobacteriales bacterium]|nr:DUF4290 domain-containing protein [Flavobacteriales bacterium]